MERSPIAVVAVGAVVTGTPLGAQPAVVTDPITRVQRVSPTGVSAEWRAPEGGAVATQRRELLLRDLEARGLLRLVPALPAPQKGDALAARVEPGLGVPGLDGA